MSIETVIIGGFVAGVIGLIFWMVREYIKTLNPPPLVINNDNKCESQLNHIEKKTNDSHKRLGSIDVNIGCLKSEYNNLYDKLDDVHEFSKETHDTNIRILFLLESINKNLEKNGELLKKT